MKEINDFPMEVIIHMEGQVLKFHCDMAAFLDPVGNWFGVIVDEEPIFSAPRHAIYKIEYTYHDKKQEEAEEKEKKIH